MINQIFRPTEVLKNEIKELKKNPKQQNKTSDELDAELSSYMMKTKGGLDEQLDSYMAQSKNGLDQALDDYMKNKPSKSAITDTQ